ncbi:hypothetical protein SNEBB_003174 [Seison nebaliae]|nr:hypothetical protein SNEBB_003174 [Seison nebaliae]
MSAATAPQTQKENDSRKDTAKFECRICLDTAHQPIVTNCGHLFCWECFGKWKGNKTSIRCPACTASLVENSITPIYVNEDETDYTKTSPQNDDSFFQRNRPGPSRSPTYNREDDSNDRTPPFIFQMGFYFNTPHDFNNIVSHLFLLLGIIILIVTISQS